MVEKQEKLMDELEARGVTPEEMQRMLEQHHQQMNDWELAVEEERRLQKERL
ncbi:MAG: hypothetical protein V2I33_16780 [Kangiellaceae bacterium]|jgi:hypothetical protein|nr:hypothetical protein [Kangiellaceae bacterium]